MMKGLLCTMKVFNYMMKLLTLKMKALIHENTMEMTPYVKKASGYKMRELPCHM